MVIVSIPNLIIVVNSLSASPRVALNWAWASISPWISSRVWTMNMSTRSSLGKGGGGARGGQRRHKQEDIQEVGRKQKNIKDKIVTTARGISHLVPSSQLLKGAARLANSRWRESTRSKTWRGEVSITRLGMAGGSVSNYRITGGKLDMGQLLVAAFGQADISRKISTLSYLGNLDIYTLVEAYFKRV